RRSQEQHHRRGNVRAAARQQRRRPEPVEEKPMNNVSRTAQRLLILGCVVMWSGRPGVALANPEALSIGGTNAGTVESLSRTGEQNGNYYVAGKFNGRATFGDQTFDSSGNYHVFVAKYDVLGNVLWVSVPQTTPNTQVFEVKIGADNSGNVYLAAIVSRA